MIIGLHGRKQCGKDSFASMLSSAVPSFRRVSFARRLKEVCVKVYGLSWAQVEDPIGKEMPLPSPIALDSRLEALRAETGIHSIGPLGLLASTPRQVLQFVGTDYVRAESPTYWLDIVSAQFRSEPSVDFVVTDVRFDNEAECIRSFGGKVLRIQRLAQEMHGDKSVSHSSEAGIKNPDFTLAITEGDYSLPSIVCDFAKRGVLLEGLAAFNWDWLAFSAPVAAAYYHDMWPSMCCVASEMFDAEATK